MILKNCEFCKKEIMTKYHFQRFCNPICQGQHYQRRPEIREKNRIRMREYRKDNPVWREKHRLLAQKYKEKRALYDKEYRKRPEIKERINKRDRERRKNDKQYAIVDRLRRSLHHALSRYSKTGKIASSKKYGLNWKAVITHLKPFPESLNEFEIDHIIPLHSFDLNNIEEIKKAFSPFNLQWLTIEDNRKKSGKILINYR